MGARTIFSPRWRFLYFYVKGDATWCEMDLCQSLNPHLKNSFYLYTFRLQETLPKGESFFLNLSEKIVCIECLLGKIWTKLWSPLVAFDLFINRPDSGHWTFLNLVIQQKQSHKFTFSVSLHTSVGWQIQSACPYTADFSTNVEHLPSFPGWDPVQRVQHAESRSTAHRIDKVQAEDDVCFYGDCVIQESGTAPEFNFRLRSIRELKLMPSRPE